MKTTTQFMEIFNDVMSCVPQTPVVTPTSFMEGRSTRLKKPPLSDMRKEVECKNKSKQNAVRKSKKDILECSSKITEVYNTFVVGGLLDQASALTPTIKDNINLLKQSISEATSIINHITSEPSN